MTIENVQEITAVIEYLVKTEKLDTDALISKREKIKNAPDSRRSLALTLINQIGSNFSQFEALFAKSEILKNSPTQIHLRTLLFLGLIIEAVDPNNTAVETALKAYLVEKTTNLPEHIWSNFANTYSSVAPILIKLF